MRYIALLCLLFSPLTAQAIPVIAKTGSSFAAGQGGTLTGMVTASGAWEIETAAAGARPDVIVQGAVSSSRSGNAEVNGRGPFQLLFSTNVSARDVISTDGSGGFQRRTSSGTAAGLALTSCTAKSRCWAILTPSDALAPARSTALGSTADPTYGSLATAVIPEMTVSLTTRGGPVLCWYSGVHEIRDGDNFLYALYVDGSVATGTARQLRYTSATASGSTAGLLPAATASTHAILTGLDAGAHTIEARWSRLAGTARAVGTSRRLDCVELGQ